MALFYVYLLGVILTLFLLHARVIRLFVVQWKEYRKNKIPFDYKENPIFELINLYYNNPKITKSKQLMLASAGILLASILWFFVWPNIIYSNMKYLKENNEKLSKEIEGLKQKATYWETQYTIVTKAGVEREFH